MKILFMNYNMKESTIYGAVFKKLKPMMRSEVTLHAI
jgi:hypothetical protein